MAALGVPITPIVKRAMRSALKKKGADGTTKRRPQQRYEKIKLFDTKSRTHCGFSKPLTGVSFSRTFLRGGYPRRVQDNLSASLSISVAANTAIATTRFQLPSPEHTLQRTINVKRPCSGPLKLAPKFYIFSIKRYCTENSATRAFSYAKISIR